MIYDLDTSVLVKRCVILSQSCELIERHSQLAFDAVHIAAIEGLPTDNPNDHP